LQEKAEVKRGEIMIDYDLPMRDEYDVFISQFIDNQVIEKK
jgi:hypothetical protein